MVEAAKKPAHFRLIIVDGKAYVQKSRKSSQTRDVQFTRLLRWYPGRLPYLELMFDCDDQPVFQHWDFEGANAIRPPLFQYCGDDHTFDLVFPDWSFLGLVCAPSFSLQNPPVKAETNVKPWRDVISDIKKVTRGSSGMMKYLLAYWRGNPHISPVRGDLMRCNITEKQNYNTLLYVRDWDKESKWGNQHSNPEDQCTHSHSDDKSGV
ncbi:Glycosyl transferase CAP10 domain [Dillenia turbinata]|uniref:Glycosyl transferase CAP10 domain n=1 Tax=Dillenia turbinata TaxID=194707 RepID=A0AAN8UVI0_9MAGN